MSLLTFSEDEVVAFANVAMFSTVEGLRQRGQISDAQAKAFLDTHAFVSRKKSWTDYLSPMLKKLLGLSDRMFGLALVEVRADIYRGGE